MHTRYRRTAARYVKIHTGLLLIGLVVNGCAILACAFGALQLLQGLGK